MEAQAAAAKIIELAHDSGTATYMHYIYGPGAFYRSFATKQEARAFANDPVLDDFVMYHSRDRVGMFGDVVLGAVTAERANDVIVIVDVIEAPSTRTSASKIGGTITQTLALVPINVNVEQLPNPLDAEKVDVVNNLIRDMIDATSTSRELYFIDCEPECIAIEQVIFIEASEFSLFVDEICTAINADEPSPETSPEQAPPPETSPEQAPPPETSSLEATKQLPEALRTLIQVHETHDPTKYVVVWVRSPEISSVWLLDRSNTPAVVDE